MAQYFYDAQIRRFILQFIRYFADYQVEFSKDANGNPIYLTVPVRYADNNRAVASILKGNSENTLQNVPMMVVYIENLKYHRQHIQDPTFVEKVNIRERAVDPLTGEIKTYQKNALTIERMMPVPYRLDLKLDIYTSNIEQKLQLLEQIAVLFNPSLEIQSTENYLDWTSLSWIMLTDVNFSSKSIPQGIDDSIDVATLTFEIPVYITAPAKVKKLNAVTAVVANIYDAQGNLAQSILDQYLVEGQRQWFTPSGYNAIVANGQIILSQNTLVGTNTPTGIPVPVNDPIPWRSVINYVGEISNGVSQMAFVSDTTGNTTIGTIAYDPTDETVLLFNVDPLTTPSNTLAPVSHIIDPATAGPGINLPAAVSGQRYLLINSNISSPSNDPMSGPAAWKNIDGTVTVAYANDIIEYVDGFWEVIFESATSINEEFVTNLHTNVQYKWVNGYWQKSWEGLYKEGYWLLII
jgi:hypothetical protein